jgi:hypothetical protein
MTSSLVHINAGAPHTDGMVCAHEVVHTRVTITVSTSMMFCFHMTPTLVFIREGIDTHKTVEPYPEMESMARYHSFGDVAGLY